MGSSIFARFVVLIPALTMAGAASAQRHHDAVYRFELIADTSALGGFASLTQPSINNRGQVAFGATLAGGGARPAPGVYVGDGRATRRIFISNTADENLPGYELSVPTISDDGHVAFNGIVNGSPGVFTGNGTLLTRIFSGLARVPVINNRRQVAFVAADQSLPPQSIVYVGNGGPLTSLGPGHYPDINDGGTVVFYRGGAIQAWNKGSTVTLAPAADPAYSRPAVNHAGKLLYVQVGAPPLTTALRTVYKGRTDTIASNQTGPFEMIASRAINDRGDVVFWAMKNTFVDYGLYTGPDVREDKLVETGDALFGSTVAWLAELSAGKALNDRGQVAFLAGLADGRAVVVRATPLCEGLRKRQAPHTDDPDSAAGSVFRLPF